MRTHDWTNDTRRRAKHRTRVLVRCSSCDELVEVTPAIPAEAFAEAHRDAKPIADVASVVSSKCKCGNVATLRGGDK